MGEKDKIPGYERNSIFIPAAGYFRASAIEGREKSAYYWSSTRNEPFNDRGIERKGENVSANHFKGNVETIIVCNRCTDKTEEIAKANGAVVVINEDRCIAKVRNAGIKAAKEKVIVTIDCDNRMTPTTIAEAYHLLKTGKYIGGGAPI